MAKLMGVRFLKSHHKYAYFKGDAGKVREEDLKELIENGYVALFPGEEPEENPLPADFPARELLFKNGIKTVKEAKEMGEAVTDINGIGKATLKEITAY